MMTFCFEVAGFVSQPNLGKELSFFVRVNFIFCIFYFFGCQMRLRWYIYVYKYEFIHTNLNVYIGDISSST